MEQEFISKYPFSKAAKRHAESLSITMEGDFLELGRRRAEAALLKGKIPAISGAAADPEEELLSYVSARMLVSLAGGGQSIRRYAIAEAKRASSYLKSDSDENIREIAGEFGFESDSEVPVLKYVRYAPKVPAYKLSNRSLQNGMVALLKNEFIRVLEEAIRAGIEGSLPITMADPPAELKQAAERLKAKIRASLPKQEAVVPSGEMPPCMLKLIEGLKMGENLSHSARWTLVIYLLKRRMPQREIIRMFSTSPDYDERVTRYQVGYIAKKGYSMPSCRLIDSNGLCVYKCGIRSPLQFKGKRFNKYAEKK